MDNELENLPFCKSGLYVSAIGDERKIFEKKEHDEAIVKTYFGKSPKPERQQQAPHPPLDD